MSKTGWAIIIAAFIAGAFYYEAEEKKAEAAYLAACLSNGGHFYTSWNWKPVCEKAAAR